MIKISLKIGRFPLQIEFREMKHLHKFGSIYGNLPQKCDACGSDNIFLSFKNPGGNDYYTLQCGACTADANFGLHKDGSGLFWKREKMTVYVPKENSQSQGNNNADGGSQEKVNIELENFEPPAEGEEVPF